MFPVLCPLPCWAQNLIDCVKFWEITGRWSVADSLGTQSALWHLLHQSALSSLFYSVLPLVIILFSSKDVHFNLILPTHHMLKGVGRKERQRSVLHLIPALGWTCPSTWTTVSSQNLWNVKPREQTEPFALKSLVFMWVIPINPLVL